MLNEIAAAIDRQDYRTAAQLLRELEQDQPQDPWVVFYRGRLQEVAGQLEAAEKTFRQVLKLTPQVKLTNLSRKGIQRVQKIEQEQRQRALAQATQDPAGTEPGCLILEPMESEAKSAAAPRFARLLKLDPYTARLHLPSRGWRFYRSGPIGELQYYVKAMAEIGVPAFCVPLSRIATVPLFRVVQLEGNAQQAQASCRDRDNQAGTLTFDWSEVKLWVEGLLPLFESVVDKGYWGLSTVRKEKTQDYAQVVDLFLPDRGCIVRLCDRTYEFPNVSGNSPLKPGRSGQQLGRSESSPAPLSQPPQLPNTHHQKWQKFLQDLQEPLDQVQKLKGFTAFAETVLDQDIFLGQIAPNLDLFRQEDSTWDNAFQLYSALAYIHKFELDR
ncbi:MAG: tetratricopeptide repeat protein [Prochlorothrix sp.]